MCRESFTVDVRDDDPFALAARIVDLPGDGLPDNAGGRVGPG